MTCAWCEKDECPSDCAGLRRPNPDDVEYCLGWIRLQMQAANEATAVTDPTSAHNCGVLDRVVMGNIVRWARAGAKGETDER